MSVPAPKVTPVKAVNVLQFICPSGFYGAEMWILALAKNLDREKVNCALAVTRESDTQNLEICRRFGSLGLETHEIPMRGRFDPGGIAGLVRYVKEHRISVIHTHGYKSDLMGLLAGRIAGVKVIATPHGFENAPNRKLQLFISIGSRALKRLDAVAPLSDELRSDVRKLGVSPERIHLIQNGVDLEEIEAERSRETVSPWPSGEKTIGYVGQIAHRKNIGDLIRAFDLLHAEHPGVRLCLVGDGPQRADLEALAASLPCAPHIEFMGYRSDRLSLMKHFDIFAMTSSLEGIPRCMMEALAMEVPVAAFSIPGVDKLVIHEKTGLLAQFGDAAGLCGCFTRLLDDTGLARNVARKGRQHVLDNFSAKRMADEYTALYEKLVAGINGNGERAG